MDKEEILNMIQKKIDKQIKILAEDSLNNKLSQIQWGIHEGKKRALEELYREIMRST